MKLDVCVRGLLTWITVVWSSLLVRGVHSHVNAGACQYRKWERPGSLVIQVLAGIHKPGINGGCSRQLTANTVEQLVALDWTVEIINGRTDLAGPLIPGQTIGYTIYDTCGNNDRAVDLLYTNKDDCDLPDTSNETLIIGILSLTNVDVTRTVSRLVGKIPVIRSLPSSPGLSTVDQPNLLSTVTSFQQEAMALIRVLQHYDMNVVVLLHENTNYGEEMADTFKNLASLYGICINYTGLTTQQSKETIHQILNTIVLNKTISVVYLGHEDNLLALFENANANTRPFGSTINWVFGTAYTGTEHVTEKLQVDKDNIVYLTYESGVYNHKFKDYFSSMFPPNASHPLYSITKERADEVFFPFFIDGDWEPRHVMDAVFTFVESARETLQGSCQTQNISTCVPDDFYTRTMQSIKTLAFNVSEYLDEQEGYPYSSSIIAIESNGHQRFTDLHMKLRMPSNQILYPAVYKLPDDELILRSPPINLPPSVCKTDCPTCIHHDEMRYSYLHGDVLILGLFSIRQYGDSIFSCGRLRRGTNDIITVSTFMVSVIQKRRETGINFGAIAIDDCYNGLNTQNYLLELFNNRKFIKDPSTQRIIDFSKVVSVIGALSSSVTLQFGDLMTSLQIPVISYGASSPELDDRNRYPYFLRTVPSDTLQVQGMIELLSDLKVTHVGLLYLDDAYGRSGKRRLLEAAIVNNICVKDPISVAQDMTDDQIKDAIHELFNQQVRVVLFFSIDSIAHRLLEQLHMLNTDKPLTFLASDGWGTNQHLIDGELGFHSHGSLIFTVGSRNYNDPGYKHFLLNLNITKTENNHWIPNYFEDYNQCYLKTSYEKDSSTPQRSICDYKNINTVLDQDTVNSLYTDQRAVHTKIAVHAATEGYRYYCQKSVGCTPARARDDITGFVGEIKLRKIDDSSIFDETRNGNIGFDVHNIQIVDRKASYVKIGTFQSRQGLVLSSVPKFYNTYHSEVTLNTSEEYSNFINCWNFPGACSAVCKIDSTTPLTTERPSTTTASHTPKPDKEITTVAVILGVLLAGVLVVLVILVCVVIRMYRQQTQKMSEISASAGFSSAGSVIQDEYDTPSSVNKSASHFSNFAFVNDDPNIHTDVTSSGGHVQYSDVRQVKHARQRSNQELGIGVFHSLDHRPSSALSAPVGSLTPARRRAHLIKPETFTKYPHKTPSSAPIKFVNQSTYRHGATNSPPRFRYGSSRSGEESHYNLPNDGSNDDLERRRRHGVSTDDINHSDITSPGRCEPESYLEPTTADTRLCDSSDNSDDEPKITYLTSKDLMHSDSDSEEDAGEVTQTDNVIVPASNNRVASPPDSSRHTSSTGSVVSPTDREVMDINYKRHENLNKTLNDDFTHDSLGRMSRTGVTDNQSVPDIIKHGMPYEEDGVFII